MKRPRLFKRRSVAAAGLALPLGTEAAYAQTPPGPAQMPIAVVQSIDDLKKIEVRPQLTTVIAYHRDGERGGGTFRWVPGDTLPPDDALIISPHDDPPGRFRRLVAGPVDVAWFGARGDGIADDTAPLQAALDHCATQEPYGPALYLPTGQYRITAPLSVPRRYIQIVGDGMWRSQILFRGGTKGGLVARSMRYLNPVLRDFALVGDVASGKGIDFSAVHEDVYLGELKNLRIESGDDALFMNSLFSMVIDNVVATSYRGHSFRALCGPSVAWRNCYAMVAGPGKAGYRLAGAVALYSCNGVNQANYWGVFGCDPAATDGFQRDFAEAALAHVTMVECNVEDFGTGSQGESGSGILLHNAYRQFHMIGGKFMRTLTSGPYHSVVRSRIGPSSPGAIIRLGPGLVDLGSGLCSTAPLFSDGRSFFADESGALAAKNITAWREGTTNHQLIRMTAVTDAAEQPAVHYSGLSSDRMVMNGLTLGSVSLAPGSEAIVANEKMVVVTANTMPTTVRTIGLRAEAPSHGSSLLIVQVGDDNTTFHHTSPAGGGLHLKGDTDYKARKGDVLMFVRLVSRDGAHPGWTQV